MAGAFLTRVRWTGGTGPEGATYMVVSTDLQSPPDPEQARTWPGFTEKLRELHVWCGRPKYATLSKVSGLAPSAISNLIGKNPLSRPPEAATLRFVEACLTCGGRTPKEVREQSRRWQDTWTALAVDEPGTAPTAAPEHVTGRRWISIIVAGAVVAGLGAGAWALSRPSSGSRAVAVPTGGGSSAARCTYKASSIKDERTGQTWRGLFECPNTPGPDVYEWAREGEVIGHLESNPSWFVCWVRGEPHRGGNDIWYYTQGDQSAAKKELQAWGFLPAVNVDTKTDPDPAVTRQCTFG